MQNFQANGYWFSVVTNKSLITVKILKHWN